MNSLDTTILLYGTNQDCAEFVPANGVIEDALGKPEEWIVADQVYFELYRLLQNKIVLENPLTSLEAFETVSFFRNKSGWMHCCYETPFWSDAEEWMKKDIFSGKNVFDLKLAITLKNNGVQTFYTRNAKDFEHLNYFSVINPINA